MTTIGVQDGWSVAEPHAGAVADRLRRWDAEDGTRRLWARDASLWTGSDEARWLGWLDAIEAGRAGLEGQRALAEGLRADGVSDVLLLGMGGSSLCPEVLAETFGPQPGWPRLHVLDSTDPAQVAEFDARVDPARAAYIVSSKSGSTLEPNIFKAHFAARARERFGDEFGSRFVAITDPGSKLEGVAREERFRAVVPGDPSIGGRYSALSPFGLVPAAVMGLDVGALLDRAAAMADACRGADAARNPGVALGVLLGTLATRGVDKLTLVVSPRLYDLGAWLEQLVAESTGKDGKAIIPVDREALGAPGVYGDDRVFAYIRLADAADAAQDAAVAALAAAGHPVVRLDVASTTDLFAEFFRWEIATAVAGAVMQLNPFNQPDVEASKIETRKLTDDYERTGRLPDETPIASGGGLALYTDPRNAAALREAAPDGGVADLLRAHLARLSPGDYFAVLAYVPMSGAHEARLQRLRHHVRDTRRVATCLGFGPRFLHSTGQAYKGGPSSGVFLQVTCEDGRDLPVPGQRYTFGVVKAAQARGDFEVLAARGRRALRVHLGADVAAGLAALGDLVTGA